MKEAEIKLDLFKICCHCCQTWCCPSIVHVSMEFLTIDKCNWNSSSHIEALFVYIDSSISVDFNRYPQLELILIFLGSTCFIRIVYRCSASYRGQAPNKHMPCTCVCVSNACMCQAAHCLCVTRLVSWFPSPPPSVPLAPFLSHVSGETEGQTKRHTKQHKQPSDTSNLT